MARPFRTTRIANDPLLGRRASSGRSVHIYIHLHTYYLSNLSIGNENWEGDKTTSPSFFWTLVNLVNPLKLCHSPFINGYGGGDHHHHHHQHQEVMEDRVDGSSCVNNMQSDRALLFLPQVELSSSILYYNRHAIENGTKFAATCWRAMRSSPYETIIS